jgi:conjugative relaxase-like TrwC/TraI family protein
MLSAKPQLNLQSAREYFREHLCAGDYYSAGREVRGEWVGQGAEMLGMKGAVNEGDFLALCEGRNPATGERMTARLNSVREHDGRMVANRRVFYDFTLSPPKSVSVVGLLQDDRILALHDRAVLDSLRELEKFAETRVRKAGADEDRHTGNVVAATFQHHTSREIDPHLHTHCVVFNATFDANESRWKALQVQGMYRAQKFAENYYYHELSKGLRSLGYEIENNGRDFEIKGVPREVVARFSKRHEQIDAETKKRIAREGLRGDLNAVRRQVAEEKRKRKMKNSTAASLRPHWRQQLSQDEAKALAGLKPAPPGQPQKPDVAAIVAWADEHLFERRSVVNDFELMAASLARGRGQDFGLATLRDAIHQRGYFREQETSKITSREVLGWELEVVVAAHDGRNRHGALSPGYQSSPSLSTEQKRAVDRILGTRDFITVFRGGAGTGKSFTLQEIERGLRAADRPIVVLAPQRQQVSDLRAAGLPAETVSLFLEKRGLPRGAVVIVDEAGQIGAKQLAQLLRIVRANEGRVILSGDTRQHGAVAASDALHAIEKHAGLRPAVIQQIRRQDPKLGASAKERGFIRSYRAAVKAASKGNIIESFNRLDRLGCVREIGADERRDALAAEYRAATARKEKPLVVAQTRDEARQVNEAVREGLRATGKLRAGTALSTLQPVDLGEAQKRDPRFYQPGQHACFLRSYGRFRRGDAAAIVAANDTGLVLLKDGRETVVGFRYADRFVVAAASELEVAAGDRLQLKFNGKSVEGAPLNNGELVTVRRVKKDGAIVVNGDDGVRKTLSPSQRVFVRGYAVTSYGSQGKTVDTVIFADAGSRAATNSEQWYVTISRGRKRVIVFTSDKESLRANVERIGGRELALDLNVNISPVASVQTSDWAKRSLAAIERVRQHNRVMECVHAPSNHQRIKL